MLIKTHPVVWKVETKTYTSLRGLRTSGELVEGSTEFVLVFPFVLVSRTGTGNCSSGFKCLRFKNQKFKKGAVFAPNTLRNHHNKTNGFICNGTQQLRAAMAIYKSESSSSRAHALFQLLQH